MAYQTRPRWSAKHTKIRAGLVYFELETHQLQNCKSARHPMHLVLAIYRIDFIAVFEPVVEDELLVLESEKYLALIYENKSKLK